MWRRLSELSHGQHVYCRSVADNFVRKAVSRRPVDTGWMATRALVKPLEPGDVGTLRIAAADCITDEDHEMLAEAGIRWD